VNRRDFLGAAGALALPLGDCATLPRASPLRIVDAHCHVFNASDLPFNPLAQMRAPGTLARLEAALQVPLLGGPTRWRQAIAGAGGNRRVREHPRLAHRLLFGSDWSMVALEPGCNRYREGFEAAMLPVFGAELPRVLSANALELATSAKERP
jgi:hypothetical protein